jgi:drug/metabolite transporter (DMT)-like permease
MFSRLGRSIGALAMNLLKCAIALLLLAITLGLWDGRLWPAQAGAWSIGLLGVSGIVGLTIGDTAFFQALSRIGARRTLLLTALTPAITAVLAWPEIMGWGLGEPITGRMLLGMTLTMGGVAWVIAERNPNESADEPMDIPKVGIMWALLSAFCQALANVLTKAGGADVSALDISIVRLVFGVTGLAIVLGAMSRLADTVEPMRQPRKAALLLVATFIGTYLGIWLSMAGLRYTEFTGIAATLSSTSPIFVLPLAYAFEDEYISARAVAGAVIAVVGIGILSVPWDTLTTLI